LITPFKEDGSIDYDALVRLVEYQLDNGADFFCILATTGEAPCLTQAEKNELSILQNNQNSLASCVGIESLCEQAKPGIWVEHAKFLQHKDTGKLLVLSLDYLENNDTAKTLHNRYTASLLPQADRTEAWHYAWRTFLRSVTFLLLFNLLSMIFALFEKKTTAA